MPSTLGETVEILFNHRAAFPLHNANRTFLKLVSAGGEPIRLPRWRPIVEMVVVVRELRPGPPEPQKRTGTKLHQ